MDRYRDAIVDKNNKTGAYNNCVLEYLYCSHIRMKSDTKIMIFTRAR